MGLASFGLDVGIFYDSLHSVILLNVISGPDFLGLALSRPQARSAAWAKGNSKAISATFVYKQSAADNARARANVHHGMARDKSDCHFRQTATDYDRRPGISWLSCAAK